jgi:Tol biopolymer transport system component
MALAPGTRLGPYEILAPLGAGGMGEVWKARDTRLARDVAVKVLPEEFLEGDQKKERFEREARALAALNHPNIAAVHSFEEFPGSSGSPSRHVLVMELLEGENLRGVISRCALPVRRTLEIAEQVAQGLAAAHEKGIVHRDVKPENVFVTKDGHVKILDFGLARAGAFPAGRDETESPTVEKLTSGGAVIGTVAYMSPEQARGEAVDLRSDQFSLGVVLYEMLAGARPFGGTSAAETLAAIIRDEPEPLTKLDPKLPVLLGWIVQRCLSKDPEERYASTKDLARELQNLRTHLSEAVSATSVAPSKTHRLRRRVPYWALAAAVALAAVVGLIAGNRVARTQAPPASTLRLAVAVPVDAAADTFNQNPLALSPDGKTLVYAGSKLFVRRLDRDEIRPIPGTDGASDPFISPDGLEVAFFAEKKLKKVSLAGGSPMSLCEAPLPHGGSWGTDGTIVFTPSGISGLWRIAASGGEPRRVTTPENAEAHHFPQILPDGEHVLFNVWGRNWISNAAVVSLRTGEKQILVEDAAYPRYLPTGHLVFSRPGSLFAVPFSLKRLETSSPPVPLLDDLVTNSNFKRCAEYAFSLEGTLVYVPTRQLQRTLVWVDRKGAAERVPLPPAGYEEVALSPDEGRLAAIAVERRETMTLLFGDFVRGTLSRSTAEGTFQALAWTPDGKRVAVGFGPESRKQYGVYWQSADGSTPPERLTNNTGAQEFPNSFSPDGSLLLVHAHGFKDTSSANTGWDIFVLPLSGERTLRPFLQTKFGEFFAQFSPDGRWVAYHSDESGRIEVFVRPYPGPGPKWQVSTEGGQDVRWTRSGRELCYRQADKMMAVDVETKPTFRAGRPRTLFEGRYLNHGFKRYDVAADGSRFLMIKEDPAESGPAHVNVVLNWFEEVKRRASGAK